MHIHPLVRIAVGLLTCASLAGCSAVTQPLRKASHLTGKLSLAATVEPGANQDTPVAVDVVAVNDKKILADVTKFTAAQWFSNKRDFLLLHPGELRVFSWEWVPGEQLASVNIPDSALADGILLFSNYRTPGGHSAVLPSSGMVHIDFGAKDFQILPPSK